MPAPLLIFLRSLLTIISLLSSDLVIVGRKVILILHGMHFRGDLLNVGIDVCIHFPRE